MRYLFIPTFRTLEFEIAYVLLNFFLKLNQRHNQSFSFKMLNKWIAESESQPVQLRSKKDEEEEQQKQAQQAAIKRSEGG